MLTKATGKYIATVDPDAVVHAHALQALLAFMNTHADAGAVTASLFNPDGSPQLYFRRILTPKIFFFTTVFGRLVDKWFLGLREWKRYRYDDLDVSKVSEVEQPAWPCLVWRHEALGDFIVNPEIPFYFLDVDMSRRVYDRGFHIYEIDLL
jgi:GT2 family glycosyltransferase